MKRSLTFFAAIAAWALLCMVSLPAHAQTTINIEAQTCNIAQTVCVLVGDGGQTIMLTMPANTSTYTMDIDGVPYVGRITATAPVQECPPLPQGCFFRSYSVMFLFTPTAELSALRSFSRSGSGRGGWTWHEHWTFFAVTVY